MGFLDNVMNELTGSGKDSLLKDLDLEKVTKTLLSSDGNNSNLDSIVSVLKQSGLDKEVTSWVGKGENAPVDPSDLSKALDSKTISDLSSKLGVNESQVSSILAGLLPTLVNQLTPEGKEGDGDNSIVSSGMNLLKGFL